MASFLLASSRAASHSSGDSPAGHADLRGSPGLGLTLKQGRTRVSRHAGELSEIFSAGGAGCPRHLVAAQAAVWLRPLRASVR